MHAHREHAARRLREAHRGVDVADPRPDPRPCAACGGARGRACGACGGAGWVRTPAPPAGGPGPLDPAVAEACGEFLAAWGDVERHGLGGWLAAQGPGAEADERFLDGLRVVGAELARLELESEVAEALAGAAERRRAETAGR